MILREVWIKHYRSLRDVWFRPQRVTTLVGPNGVGKTNLYRALRLLHVAALGRLGRSIAEEGTLASVFWAGDKVKQKDKYVELTATFDEYRYHLAFGFPDGFLLQEPPSVFASDPVIKTESLEMYVGPKWASVAKRKQSYTEAMDSEGRWHSEQRMVSRSETMVAEIREPGLFPSLWQMHDEFANWRFYHEFRTDAEAVCRKPCPSTMTRVLDASGGDVAAAIKTIRMIGDAEALDTTLREAFPKATIDVREIDGPRLLLQYEGEGVRRRFASHEISDGTMRYLCLVAALLSPNPPPLLVLNEPETSLHPDLLVPLARLIARAVEETQVLLTTHSEPLAAAIEAETGIPPLRLARGRDGSTTIDGGMPASKAGFSILGDDASDDEEDSE